MPFELAYTLCTPASCFATHFCNPCTKCMICSCIWCMLANMNPPTVCGVPDRDCLKRFQMQVSWFYLFTGISLGWFGFISSFFKYYRGKFGVISFVVSLYEQFYCTLWGSSSTSGLQIWYFNEFTLKVTMEARNYYIKSKDFYHWDLELFIFPSLLYYFNPIFRVSSCILSSLCLC